MRLRHIALLLLLFLAFTSRLAAQPNYPPVIVILLPGMSIDDWIKSGLDISDKSSSITGRRSGKSLSTEAIAKVTGNPLPVSGGGGEVYETGVGSGIFRWRQRFAITSTFYAIMNTRTARLPSDHIRESPESAVLTLGAGARAAGGPEAAAFLPDSRQSPIGGVTARDLYARRTGTHPTAGHLVNVNWPQVLAVNEHLGYRVHIGNLADTLRLTGVDVYAAGGPMAALLAAGSDGTAEPAPVGKMLPNDNARNCLWIIDPGSDLKKIGQTIDLAYRFTAKSGGRLLLISPSANDQDYGDGKRLTPVILIEPSNGKEPQAGYLYSPSTRQIGLVTNTEIAPTIASWFGCVLPNGTLLTTRPTLRRNPLAWLSKMQERSVDQRNAMKVLPYYAIFAGIWIILFTLLCTRISNRAICLLTLAPLIPWLVGSDISKSSLMAGTVFFFLVCLIFEVRSPIISCAISSAIWVMLCIDMLLGSHSFSHSVLGYSWIEGARYYGIGNEAMGVLIGSMLVTTTSLWKRHSKIIRAAACGAILLTSALIGYPGAGAKAGGVIVTVGTFAVYFGTLLGWRWNARKIAAVILVGVGLTLAVSLLDARHGAAGQSHFGRAIHLIMQGGAGEGLDIVLRKLAVEGRLLYHSAWALPLWASVMGLALYYRRNRDRQNRNELATLNASFMALGLCVAFNDAGTVAGALCGIVVWSYHYSQDKILAPRILSRSSELKPSNAETSA